MNGIFVEQRTVAQKMLHCWSATIRMCFFPPGPGTRRDQEEKNTKTHPYPNTSQEDRFGTK